MRARRGVETTLLVKTTQRLVIFLLIIAALAFGGACLLDASIDPSETMTIDIPATR